MGETVSRMVDLFEPAILSTHQREWRRGEERNLTLARKDMVNEGGDGRVLFRVDKRDLQTNITVIGRETILNANKWLKAVIIEMKDGRKEWTEIKRELNIRFGRSECKILEDGKLLLFLATEEETKELVRVGELIIRGVALSVLKRKNRRDV
ncbi:hypothetical protein FRX31_035537, partial [Thalictrum thalictroides]